MSLVGKENFYHGISKKEHLLTKTVLDFLQNSGVRTPSLKQIEKADAILVLGEDLTNTAPMIALALRQAVRNVPNEEAREKGIPLWNDAPVRELAQDAKSPVFIVTPFNDPLDEIAENHSEPLILILQIWVMPLQQCLMIRHRIQKLIIKISRSLQKRLHLH